jgi:hypothetical protein
MKMSNKLMSVIAILAFTGPLMADEAAVAPAPATVAPATEPAPEAKPQTYKEALQAKYSLTPEQMKSLNDSNLPESQLVKVAQLSKSSGKTIDEVLAMRNEQKMGWGKIAKTLGVHPGELGRANSDLKRESRGMSKEKREGKIDGKAAHARKDHSHGKKNK